MICWLPWLYGEAAVWLSAPGLLQASFKFASFFNASFFLTVLILLMLSLLLGCGITLIYKQIEALEVASSQFRK